MSLLKATWCEALADLDVETIEVACLQVERTAEFFPTPGMICRQREAADAKGSELTAEHEWQKLLAWVRENVFPDTGFRRGAARLSPAIEHAAKAAGGMYFIERCSEDQLVWCRKNFLAALKNVRETDQVAHLVGDGEAKKILAQLVKGPPEPRQLAPIPEPSVQLPPGEQVRAVLDRVAGLATPTPSQEDWESRKNRLKSSALEWAAARGLSRDSNSVAKTPASATAQVLDSARPEVAISGCKESHVSATEEAGA
jgi:hypothetical protein